MKKLREKHPDLFYVVIFLLCVGAMLGAVYIYCEAKGINGPVKQQENTTDIRKTIEDYGSYEINDADKTLTIYTEYNHVDYPYWYGDIPDDWMTVDEFTSHAINKSDEDQKDIVIDHLNNVIYFGMRNGNGWIQVSAHARS